ncbi:hypothetical protein BDF14DRAFT_1910201 [Spinellus fusiger]|nr:hypothetical protein BDF14DRAFT_1910201 [Spinellus fusiger]
MGIENVVDVEGGSKPVNYIVDPNEFIVETIATHTEYLKTVASSESSLNFPMLIEKPKDEDICKKEANTKRNNFFDLKIENCMSASSAAKQLAHRWVNCIFESCEKLGEYKMTVIDFTGANPSTTVVEVTEHLLIRFHHKVSRSIVYSFMKSEHNLLSKKKADFHSIQRNSPVKIRKRTRAIVTRPTTRANTISLLSTISATRLIAFGSGTVPGHYISFLKNLDEVDKHPHVKSYFKGKYLMDVTSIRSRIEYRLYLIQW